MATRARETMPESVVERGDAARAVPGVLLVFSRGRTLYHPLPLKPGGTLTLGRDVIPGGDEKASSTHVEIAWEAGGFTVRDLGSRNGTFFDGERVAGSVTGKAGGVVRLGQTLALLQRDLSRFTTGEVRVEAGRVVGPTMRRVLERVAAARAAGAHLVLRGETGVGKELVAQTFHAAAKKPGPLISFNCANLQAGLAEARLYGTVRGAYTEARDSSGLFLQADGGTLFLDEVAELEDSVQAKLLRTLDTGEVQRVGDSAVKRVEVALVAASHQRLADRVQAGRFRADLLFRLSQFEVEVPPLRERGEEIPSLMQLALEGRGVTLHVSAVEEALVRRWTGNVRELLSATVAASVEAAAAGGVVRAEHLPEPISFEGDPAPEVRAKSPEALTAAEVVEALAATGGNATAAAKRLGLHRTQLNRLRAKFGLSSKD